jgi:hypothetical protein
MALPGRQRSAIKINFPPRPHTGSTQVACDSNVVLVRASLPRHGLPVSVHGPHIDPAEKLRQGLGAHPVVPDEKRKYLPSFLNIAGASLNCPVRILA